jgi:heme/copper-type cytochrome/quinol oxidase subunit 4
VSAKYRRLRGEPVYRWFATAITSGLRKRVMHLATTTLALRELTMKTTAISLARLTLPSPPDNTNNVLAVAFGVLIAALVVVGSFWIMSNLNDSMMPAELMNLHMQR